MTTLSDKNLPGRSGRSPLRGDPFTLAHFQHWTESHITLDNGRHWRLQPFQRPIVEDVLRGVPEVLACLPTGNGKTTLVSGLALYYCQHLPGAVIPVAASSRDQAGIVYQRCQEMIWRSALEDVFTPLEGFRRVRCDEQHSRIQIMAFDPRTGDGIIPKGICILDELHRHPTLDLYRLWRDKLSKQKATLVAISTAGEPGSEFEQLRADFRSRRGRRERTDTSLALRGKEFALHEHALPPEGDIDDLELVKRANPFSGVTKKELRRRRKSPAYDERHWRRFTCNLPTRADAAAVPELLWHDAATAEQIPAGTPVWCGIDFGWEWDTTAIVPLWVKSNEERVFGRPVILVPPNKHNMSLDPNEVKAALHALNERTPISTVVADMHRAAETLDWMRLEFDCRVIERDQRNPSAEEDYERFMEALRAGWLRQPADDDFTRHVLNAVVRVTPGGRARFDRPERSRKAEQERRVIDALVAAAMVHAVAMANAAPSVYDQRGMVAV